MIQFRTGDASEFLVCHDLANRGFRAAISPFENAPYDLLCELDGAFLRVQVKGTRGPRFMRKNSESSYQFTLKGLDPLSFDVLALVALDLKCIHYYTSEQAAMFKSCKNVPLSEMCLDNTEALETLGAVLVQS